MVDECQDQCEDGEDVGGDQSSQVGLRLLLEEEVGGRRDDTMVGGDQISQVGLRLPGPWSDSP